MELLALEEDRDADLALLGRSPARLVIYCGLCDAPGIRLRIDDTDIEPTDPKAATTPLLATGPHTLRITATAPTLLDGVLVALAS